MPESTKPITIDFVRCIGLILIRKDLLKTSGSLFLVVFVPSLESLEFRLSFLSVMFRPDWITIESVGEYLARSPPLEIWIVFIDEIQILLIKSFFLPLSFFTTSFTLPFSSLLPLLWFILFFLILDESFGDLGT